MYQIKSEELIGFFCSRAAGDYGTLGEREFPAATSSFAPVPVMVEGAIECVRTVPDTNWDGNSYEIFRLPENSCGCVISRHSVNRWWEFVGAGGDEWFVTAPREVWRLRNVFEGNTSNSDIGPFTPDD
jgi:hypothetical protein